MPTGWEITGWRQKQGASIPATRESKKGDRLARWQIYYLTDIDALVDEGKAYKIGKEYCFYYYTLRFNYFMSYITDSQPRDYSDSLRQLALEKEVIEKCDPLEWLFVEAYDIS